MEGKWRFNCLCTYDQDYSDHDVDGPVMRGRCLLDERGAGNIEILGAAEGLTLAL